MTRYFIQTQNSRPHWEEVDRDAAELAIAFMDLAPLDAEAQGFRVAIVVPRPVFQAEMD